MIERHRAIIIKDNKLVVMERHRKGRHFWVFPGGGQEQNETQEQCVVREVKEEFGIDVETVRKIYDTIQADTHQCFFVCKWISGKIHKTDAEEYTSNDVSQYGTYNPTTINLVDIENTNLMPYEVKKQLIADLKAYGPSLDRPCIKFECYWKK